MTSPLGSPDDLEIDAKEEIRKLLRLRGIDRIRNMADILRSGWRGMFDPKGTPLSEKEQRLYDAIAQKRRNATVEFVPERVYDHSISFRALIET